MIEIIAEQHLRNPPYYVSGGPPSERPPPSVGAGGRSRQTGQQHGADVASKRKQRIDFRISHEDRERLETISEAYDVSLSDAIRMAIRVMLTQMGLMQSK